MSLFKGFVCALAKSSAVSTPPAHAEPCHCAAPAPTEHPAPTPAPNDEPEPEPEPPARTHLLLVSPDQARLEQGARRLHAHHAEWEITTLTDPEQALRRAREIGCQVVISEMELEGGTGPELIIRLLEQQPELCGLVRCDKKHLGREPVCLHEGVPLIDVEWDHEDFVRRLDQILTLQQWVPIGRLRPLLSRLRELPSLPTLYQQVVAELNSPNGSLQFAAKLVAKDPVMAAKTLQLVNSPLFGLAQPMVNAEEAVLYLGIERTKALILLAGVFSKFDKTKCPGFQPELLWLHSMGVGNIARTIVRAEKRDAKTADLAFTAGLLHDIGALLLAANLPREYSTVLAQKARRGLLLHQVEREAFGATHADLGAYLLGLWNLPVGIVRAVVWHHAPAQANEDTFSVLTAVHVANALAYEKCKPCSAHAVPIDRDYLYRLGLDDRLNEWRKVCGCPLPKEAAEAEKLAKRRHIK